VNIVDAGLNAFLDVYAVIVYLNPELRRKLESPLGLSGFYMIPHKCGVKPIYTGIHLSEP
jgi:hypothetical protein